MSVTVSAERLTLPQHLVYILSRLIAYGFPLVLFLVTSSFYLKTYDSAQIKITVTQIGTTTLFVIWCLKIFISGQIPFKKSDLLYIAPFLAFLASGLISFSHSPYKVWAMEETLRRVFYMILALIAISEMNTKERLSRLWRWIFAAGWLAIGYGVIQFLDSRFFPQPNPKGLDPFIWRQAFGARVFSTFGNPNFYGNFLVILTPLILSAVFRNKGSLLRPFFVGVVILFLTILTEKVTRNVFGGYDPSYMFIYYAAFLVLGVLTLMGCLWSVPSGDHLTSFLLLFGALIVNLISTGTKGAWLGFIAACGSTILLIMEFFLRFEERLIEPKRYVIILCAFGFVYVSLLGLMVNKFILPYVGLQSNLVGPQVLSVATIVSLIIGGLVVLWMLRKPWNLKKIIYGVLVAGAIGIGTGVLLEAQQRLTSLSFRLFTWIGTWEMVRTSPLLGNGVGTFKVIYPAFRRPEIIVLEGKSNTETDHAEDEYIEVWQDEGIIGFGIFLWMIFTAIFCGLKLLRWYALLRERDAGKKIKLLEMQNDPRSYEILGLLGAYIGALMHWFVDVSIRFVSSGVFSGVLPGLLVSYARNHNQTLAEEIRLPYERWIRVGLAFFIAAVIFVLKMQLVPNSMIRGGETTTAQIFIWGIVVSGLIYLLMELLEIGLGPQNRVSFASQYGEGAPAVSFVRIGLAVGVLMGGGYATRVFSQHFQADVNHNLAIFFSKEAIWTKSPLYDARISALPVDIKRQYQKVGGALEHYEMVVRNNPAYPMSLYFTGNVYNDWGSQINADSINARSKGDISEAERLKNKARDLWDKAEGAYTRTKKLAPNYVQVHHQVGLLYLKRADQALQWQEQDLARQYYDTAYQNFKKYQMLDPVFPQNYDRMVQILMAANRVNEAQDLYKQAIYYNDVIARSIHNTSFKDRLAQISLSLAKLYYNEALSLSRNPFQPPLPQIENAITYFQMCAQNDPSNIEAWKGLGFLLDRTGKSAEAQAAWKKVIEISPNDPDVRRVNQ